jgi:hypothetical protein
MLDRVHLTKAVGWAAGVALVAGLTVGCTGGDDSEDTATSTGANITLTQPSKPLRVKLALLTGGAKRSERARIRHAIAKPIDAWVAGGFLDVEYPQSNFPDAFQSWTQGAGADAADDRDVTTNAAVGPDVVATVAERQTAELFVFATHGHAGGATARVALRFTSQKEDSSLIHYLVRGELYLTRKGSHWQIFGYKLSREDVA